MNKPLKGLVLAGGKSTRMGTSKAKMNWYGKEQQYYLADLIKVFCGEVFISCRKDQVNDINADYLTIPDQYPDGGPVESILSAFQTHPNCGWLVLACDVPLIDKQTLEYLIEQRETSKIATVFENPEDKLPEPLIGIWEAESFDLLKYYHQKEKISLRNILIKHQAKIIKAPNIGALINANTPADVKFILKILKK